MQIRICELCGKEYESRTSTSKYCSSKCREKMGGIKQRQAYIDNRTQKKCKKCGKEFMPGHMTQVYCSETCRFLSRQIHKKQAPKVQVDDPKGLYVCKGCGETFASARKKLFCSKKCNHYYFTCLNNNLNKAPQVCSYCKKEYAGTRQKYCSSACQIAAEKARKARRKKTLSIAKINEQARSQRLSYGQLVAREWMGVRS